jgi:hypothetical protein
VSRISRTAVAVKEPNTFYAKTTGDNGTDDWGSIQEAIDRAEAAATLWKGAVVELPPLVARTSQMLTIEKDNIVFGRGGVGSPTGGTDPATGPLFGGAVIRPLPGFSGSHVLKVGQGGTPSRTLQGVQFSDFSIDGFYLPANVNGIFWQVHNGTMHHVHVERVTKDGIAIDGAGGAVYPKDAWDNFLYGVNVNAAGRGGTGDGISFKNGATDNLLTACIVKGCTGNGLFYDATLAAANMVNGCYIYNCGGKGVLSNTMHQPKFVGTRIQDCNGGIYLSHSSATPAGGVLIIGVTFRNMSFSADNTTDAINIAPTTPARGLIASGLNFHTDEGNGNGGGAGNWNRARYGINIANANMVGAVVGPFSAEYRDAVSAFGTAPINDQGTGTIISGAPGDSPGVAEFKMGNGVRVLSGAGSPEGVKTAPPGSMYLRSDGGALTCMYVKETGTGNTGWVAK